MADEVAEKNRLDTSTVSIRKDIKSAIDLLERRVVKIDKHIDTAIDADPEKAENRQRLIGNSIC